MRRQPFTIERVRERFWRRVDKSGDCWEWTGPRYINSVLKYGRACLNRKATTAHRVAWRLFVGEIPDGLFVLHRCDNPLCVKPTHLFLGTHNDNMRDMVEKGRSTAGDKHWVRRMPELAKESAKKRGLSMRGKWTGRKNPKAKLRWLDVERIRGSADTCTSLARQYGVSKGTVSSIKRGVTWQR